jgi:diadenosine tetraphosphate (Ap4A) HIT family hydrolase
MSGWADDWHDRYRGAACGMCDNAGADDTPHGRRIFDGRWCDAYLGRFPIRDGYSFVIWKGRHVAEPTELSAEEAAGFWSEVARVASALERHYRPRKMNWMSLGNAVPHLHMHLVPRPVDDPRGGGPIEDDAFEHRPGGELSAAELDAQADALRALLA